MRWPRLTTRRIMALVLGLAPPLGLIIPAVRVALDRDDHAHSWPSRVEGLSLPGWSGGTVAVPGLTLTATNPGARSPFWPRYGRYLAGRPWRRVPVCGAGEGHPGETCAYERSATAHPRGPKAGPAPAAPAIKEGD